LTNLINILEAYHAAHISALLDSLPPECVAFVTLMEYLRHGPQHGAIKALADIGTLTELPKIYNRLLSFESNRSTTAPVG
jgi:hypothetical protein